MSKIFYAELYKIRHNITFLLAIIFAIPIGMLFALVAQMDKTLCIVQLLGSLSAYYKVVFVTLVVMYVTLDYERGTIKAIISSGISKEAIYLGRMLVSVFVSIILFILIYIGAFICGILLDIPVTSAAYDWTFLQFGESIIIQILFVATYAAIAYFIGVLVKKEMPGIVIGVFVINSEPLAVSSLSQTTHINFSILDFSQAIRQMELLNINGSSILGTVLYAVIIIVITLVIGIQLFKRRDI